MNYLNINTPWINFTKVLNEDIYVDKSLLIDALNAIIGRSSRYICITRPRRFGKTINANMLGAYYTKGYDSHELFDGLAVSQTDNYNTHINKHHVFYIDMGFTPQFCGSFQEYIYSVYEKMMSDIMEMKPELAHRKFFSISDALLATGETFIFILDEWDYIFNKDFMTEADKNNYLEFLRGLLKDQPYVELAYMTGVLPIAKYSSGSELNMFREYNFMNDYVFEKYFGFSEDEVKDLCRNHTDISFESLKQWYDGYYMSDGSSLFNPRSVSCALSDGVCLNYWTETGPMNEIAECIEHNVFEVREDIVKMVAGVPVEVDLQGYSASELQLDTRDEILSAMVVYGFLSYHDGYLRIPNYELMEKFQRVLTRNSMGEIKAIVERSKAMLKATLDGDEQKVAEILEYVHDQEIPFLKYNDENALSCVITLCYLYARKDYSIEREAKSGKGYCDYLFNPKKHGMPAVILELKVDGSCDDALMQIKRRNYIQKVEHSNKVILVGINYNRTDKRHECKIEEVGRNVYAQCGHQEY